MNNSIATTAQIDALSTSIQAVYDYINSKLQGRLFTFGATTPAAADQNLPWIRTDANSSLIGVYTFNTAAQLWISPNPTPSAGKERRLWTGTESEVWSYDGGDGTDPGVTLPTDTVGAMWEIDHTADFKFLIGPGAGSTVTVAVGQTGGEETHALTVSEGAQDPAHQHVLGRMSTNSSGGADDGYMLKATGGATAIGTGRRITGGSSSVVEANINTLTGDYLESAAVVATATPAGHTNLPPYIGIFVVKRTARKFYVAA
jgi:hypothetical protein